MLWLAAALAPPWPRTSTRARACAGSFLRRRRRLDFLARTIGQAWGAQAHQPIVVDNRPGGNTAIGASETARAPADGYTVLSADNGTLIFNPVLYKSLSYNPGKDLMPVTLMGRFPMILVAGPAEKAKTARSSLPPPRPVPRA
jgi:tripartite-type tricarboxylate transporter receptor subunit TctC